MAGPQIPQVVNRGAANFTNQEKALVDAGEAMFKESISVGIDFCKTMIGIATGALALYYALFAFILPKDFRPNRDVWFLSSTDAMLVPPILFLAAAIAFAIGYMPSGREMSLDMITKPSNDSAPDVSIETARNKALQRRGIAGYVGLGLFLAGLFFTAFVIRAFGVEADIKVPTSEPQAAIVSSAEQGLVCGDLIASETPGYVTLAVDGQPSLQLQDVSQVLLVDECP